MKTAQLISESSGRPVANQFILYSNDGDSYFQSYDSIIIKWHDGKTYLDEYYWEYSKTTSRYRNQCLMEKIDETRKKIKSGEYILTNLN